MKKNKHQSQNINQLLLKWEMNMLIPRSNVSLGYRRNYIIM